MQDPTRIGCDGEHSFCKECVDYCYVVGVQECPKCKQTLEKGDVELDSALQREILLLEINCPQCQKWKGTLSKHKEHLRCECESNPKNMNNNRKKTTAVKRSISPLPLAPPFRPDNNNSARKSDGVSTQNRMNGLQLNGLGKFEKEKERKEKEDINKWNSNKPKAKARVPLSFGKQESGQLQENSDGSKEKQQQPQKNIEEEKKINDENGNSIQNTIKSLS